jgi:CheY-like chemotaxis protein
MGFSQSGRSEQVVRVVRGRCHGGAPIRAKLVVRFPTARPTKLADAIADSCASLAQVIFSTAPDAAAVTAAESAFADKIATKMRERGIECSVVLQTRWGSGMYATTVTAIPRARGGASELKLGKVLAVDDDLTARTTIEALLSDQFEVVQASNATDAERLLATERPDVIVTDYQMSGGSGLELLERAHTKFAHVIGMLITGHHDYPEVIAARSNSRIFQVLLKPYDPKALLAAVRSAVSVAKMRQSTARLGG